MLVSQIGKPMPTLYQPTKIEQNDVTFRHIKKSSGNYVALIEKDWFIEDSDDDDDHTDDESAELYEKNEIYAPLVTSKPPKTNIFSLGPDPIKNFYIGSITVVGLFILYRIITKVGKP